MNVSHSPGTQESASASVDLSIPFSLLTFPRTQHRVRGTSVARRDAGELQGAGSLTIAGDTIELHGPDGAVTPALLAAARQACGWLPGVLDGNYAIAWYREHRAPVEAERNSLAVEVGAYAVVEAIPALALAWAAAIITARMGEPRRALRAVADIYRQLSVRERAAVQVALADGTLDAGNLCALYLTRTLRETAVEELERWESWFLGQREIDLPYNRRAVIDVLEADIDPDQKRLQLNDVVRQFDRDLEQGNIERALVTVRARRQELVFGRMSRAFHNQGLLFANAAYVQVNDDIRQRVAELAAACAGIPLLTPPSDRLRSLAHGSVEVAMTGVVGALELLEDAILDYQRMQLSRALQAAREKHAVTAETSRNEIMARANNLLTLCGDFRQALFAAPQRPAAYVILSQRLSPTGSHLFARINEFQEPYLGKPENLKQLVRSSGHRMYATPEYAWLHHADHWIEAIPLFIKERVMVVDGMEVTETVIDQFAMEESFREQLADHWALNIDNVMDSEHAARARELLANVGVDGAEVIGALAVLIADTYRAHAEAIHRSMEQTGKSRYDVLGAFIERLPDTDPLGRMLALLKAAQRDELVAALGKASVDCGEKQRLAEIAHLPRRPLPVLHVLTTQSARMSDGYIRTWLEESMALFNVIRAHGLNGDVRDKIAGYRKTVDVLGAQLIRELGMHAEVEELMALEGLPEARAVSRVVAGNATIARQVSLLAVLSAHLGLSQGTEPPLVEEILASRSDALREEALRGVFTRNDLELLPLLDSYRMDHPDTSEEEAIRALILDNPDYADDLAAFTRFAAREAAIRELDRCTAGICLLERVDNWMRDHARLSLTTARRDVLLEKGLNHLTLHPLYYYRAAGGNKRFHQLYTPSRVDLGTRERESVESWAQWVGGADREAARVGRRVYGLINKNVKMFDSLTEPEVLKTGENASMVASFSYANAMSLLVNSVGQGDVEDLGDQMSLRKDRTILPGGEGYGGYCVPKDGLFLEFVLILTRAVKLRQLGVPDHLHAGVVALGKDLLARRPEFQTDLEWEAWAMRLIADRKELNNYFTLRESTDGPVPVFQITRIARALTQLGRPELTESFEVLSNLAARWGIHKIIVGGEQVNRFMPFYKVWLTYQAVEEAQRLNPQVSIKAKDFTVVLTAEYKPDTQDGRFSVGMRKYEIFAGTAEHLTYSLDVPGQDLVHLMFSGFESLWNEKTDPRLRARLTRVLSELQVREGDAASIERLRGMFPGYATPGEIRMVSPMGLATSDLLHYTSDTALEQIALEVQRRLLNVGLTENEITANMQVYGPDLARWTKIRDLPVVRQQGLIQRIGGQIHALALSILGPLGGYELGLQGADVLDTGIPHKELLALLADPVKVRDLMLEGNPNSALVIVDGASGARRRAVNRLAVMRWLGACEAGGRQGVYRSVGLGAGTVENWRREMRHQRERARELYELLTAGRLDDARERYAAILEEVRDGQETALFLENEERMLRFNKQTDQEAAVARALADVASGLPLERLDFAAWLALGGQFFTMGISSATLAEMRQAFEAAIAKFAGTVPPADEDTISNLFCPAYVPAVEEFREEKGIESSNKATEEVAAVAIDTRKNLAARAARARALGEREGAFRAVLNSAMEAPPQSANELIAEALEARGDGESISQAHYGRLLGLTRLAFLALTKDCFGDDPVQIEAMTEHAEALFTGRDFDPAAIRPICGGYEDSGDLARMGQCCAEALQTGVIAADACAARLRQVADLAELVDCCRAIDLTIGFSILGAESMEVWRALTDFFAESLNDHFYEYRPWAYSRGMGFIHLHGDELYRLAVEHHRWLYRYLRGVALCYTELGRLSNADLGEMLGDLDTAAEYPPIGADGASALERQWRAYNQLRELAFVRNDGFSLPQIFPEFDPAIIKAEERTNLLYLYPVGRTHVSRALLEGPTLAGEMEAAGQRGVNLLITRDVQEVNLPSMQRPVLQARNAHLYISREEYIAALKHHRGLSVADAEALAAEHAGPKGVRIAARFTRPITLAVIFPFHHHPKDTSGLLEALGLPYSSQSRFHTWTTYDKAKYPEIFCPETGVELPGEMDWLAADTAALGDDEARKILEHGDKTFPGFRAFSERYRLVMVKDAAESGGRGQKAFNLRLPDGAIDEETLAEAVEFTYQISQKHNVAIQEVIIASPEYWATEDFLRSFVDRQVQEWGASVNRTKRPRTNIYGSQRLIFSSPAPLQNEWHLSHPITLNSRQLITNVGRGGTLDILRKEFIRQEYRDQLWTRLWEAGEKSMHALARYEEIAGERYTQETGYPIGQDATGLSYAVPRYMMLDFLVQPIFAEQGALVDLEPVYDATGERADVRFILQQGEERIAGTVTDWRVVLIEPNIGIGLWDRVAIREEFYARATAAQDAAPIDWNMVGANARIVLKDLAIAGQEYLQAIRKT
ncbi:MAG: Rossmann-fold NAD(P)-binding domain-containing protein [Armatimonadota bacterium]